MILTMDVGTSFFKVGIVDLQGRILFFSKIGIRFDNEELDPYEWEVALRDACLTIPHKYLKVVNVVVVSGNGPTIIPIGSNGRPVHNALLWNDTRSLGYADEIQSRISQFLPPNFYLSKAFWFSKERTEVYNKTTSFLSCPEYISYLLTGEVFTLLPASGFLPFYWDNKKIEKLGLDATKFPEFISPHEAYGNFCATSIIPQLTEGIPVVCAGPDYLMSIIGSGSIDSGIICDRTGTSEGLNYCSYTPLSIEGFRTLPHLIPGLYTVAGLIPDSGEYVLNNRLETLVEQYRSILQKIIDADITINEIRVVGGHAGVEELNLMKSKCFNIPLKVYAEGSELIGNAVLGSVVTGDYPDIATACSKMVREQFCFNI